MWWGFIDILMKVKGETELVYCKTINNKHKEILFLHILDEECCLIYWFLVILYSKEYFIPSYHHLMSEQPSLKHKKKKQE